MQIGSANNQNNIKDFYPRVELAVDSELMVVNETIDGVTGSGAIIGSGSRSLAMKLENYGPYRFSGKIGKPGSNREIALKFKAQGETSAEKYRFILDNANALLDVMSITFDDGGVHPLVFGAGIGNFTIQAISGKSDAPLCLDDEDGNPVTVYVYRHCSSGQSWAGFENLAFSGSGELLTKSAPGEWGSWGRPYTNDVFKTFVGTLSVTNTGVLQLGDGVAGHDLDLSGVKKISVKASNAKVEYNNVEKIAQSWAIDLEAAGTVEIKGGGAILNGPVTGTGELILSSPSTVNDLRGNGLLRENLTVKSSADTVLNAPNGAMLKTVSVTSDNTTNTFGSGFFYLKYTNDTSYASINRFNVWYPTPIYLENDGPGRSFVIESGATVVCGPSSPEWRPRSITLREGGTLRQPASSRFNTASSVNPELIFDGGTYVMTHEGGGYGTPDMPATQVWNFKVGDKGGTIAFDLISMFGVNNDTGAMLWSAALNAAFSDNAAPGEVGPLHFRVPCSIYLKHPVAVSGPVYLHEGYIRFSDVAENQAALAGGTALGSGDLHLGQVVLDLGRLDADCEPKFGSLAGQTVTYEAGATVIGRWHGKAAQTMTFGNGSGSPFVRGGKGATLVFADRQQCSLFDGTGVKVFVNGTVPLDSTTGIMADPVFGYSYRKGSGNFGAHHFLTYDNEKGLVAKAADYENDLSQGGVVDITADMTLSESAEVAALRLDTKRLTLANGVTLKVGPDDPGRTAHVIFNSDSTAYWDAKNSGAVLGNGTIDFGRSEAVLVSDRSDSGSVLGCSIRCRVEGTGGLTVVGTPVHSFCTFDLWGDNGYSGGTWVNGTELRIRHANALGAGDIHLASSRITGGSVRFKVATTVTNDWYIGGYGSFRGNFAVSEYGAIVFNSDVTLTGDIHIDGRARIGSTCLHHQNSNESRNGDPGHGTLTGVISGGMLDISGPYDPQNPMQRYDITGANTYTGGTFIAYHRVALSGAGTLGTGPVTLANDAEIQFENDGAVVFPNDMTGFGTVRIAGSGDVRFTGKLGPVGPCCITNDLAGTSPRLSQLPPFRTIVNTSEKTAKLTLTGDSTLGADQTFGGANVDLVLDGATLDLGGQTVTLRRLAKRNGGDVVNGTVIETKPQLGTIIICM